MQCEIDKDDRTDDLENCSTKLSSSSISLRESKIPLNNIRLSFYKPTPGDAEFEYQNLNHRKSVDEFSSIRISQVKSKDCRVRSKEDLRSTIINGQKFEMETKIKRNVISSKFRSMTNKTQRLFSKIYSNTKQNEDTSSDICGDLVPRPTVANCRRSISHGALTKPNEFPIKKINVEDCDSGIFVNGSDVLSMIESDDIKKADRQSHPPKQQESNM